MKMINSLTRGLIVMTFFSLVLFSCKKEDSSAGTPAEQKEFASAASESDAEAEVVFDDVFNNVMGVNSNVALGGTGVFGGANYNVGSGGEIRNGVNGIDSTIQCYVVTVTNLNAGAVFPIKIVIDFQAGCVGRDGKTRKGKMITVYSDRLINAGATAVTTFEDFYIDDIKVEGTHKITNKSTVSSRIFHVLITGAKLSKSNGDFSQWSSEKTIAQIEGVGTVLTPLDDIFKITGAATGSVKRSDKFFQWATVISEPLIKKYACRWIVKGSITLKKSNTPVAVLDYGSGNCDNKAYFTVNGQVTEISLH